MRRVESEPVEQRVGGGARSARDHAVHNGSNRRDPVDHDRNGRLRSRLHDRQRAAWARRAARLPVLRPRPAHAAPGGSSWRRCRSDIRRVARRSSIGATAAVAASTAVGDRVVVERRCRGERRRSPARGPPWGDTADGDAATRHASSSTMSSTTARWTTEIAWARRSPSFTNTARSLSVSRRGRDCRDQLVGTPIGGAEPGDEVVEGELAGAGVGGERDGGIKGEQRRDRVVGRAGGDDVAGDGRPVAQLRAHRSRGTPERAGAVDRRPAERR